MNPSKSIKLGANISSPEENEILVHNSISDSKTNGSFEAKKFYYSPNMHLLVAQDYMHIGPHHKHHLNVHKGAHNLQSSTMK